MKTPNSIKLPKDIKLCMGTKNNKHCTYFEMNDMIYKITHYCGGSYCDIVKRLPKNCKQVPFLKTESRFVLTILASHKLAKFAKHFGIEYKYNTI